ncbi:hypothetical protein QO259_10075 [Salinicola sp. JS01]|uniref:hypothetical protein n=1 Tax=Salinicola sp. JS01 TaxID=3050071 RepID=UPI00255BB557|nr:hypothetical protein [Salinicola sp. JS01]WIX34959.1 hypothetical protein QO259_10075 [Salinicola sp. JS01]
MATTNRKRSTSAKSDAKTTETQAEQSAVEVSSATPETGESSATPAAAVISAAEPGDTPDSGPIETVTGDATSQDGEQAGETVTGDGSGEALPAVDPEAGVRTAQGTSGDELKSSASDEQAEIPALFIRTRKPVMRRRRCGHVFTPEGHGIALATLSADQIHALESDTTLIVEACTFPDQSADNGEDAQ